MSYLGIIGVNKSDDAGGDWQPVTDAAAGNITVGFPMCTSANLLRVVLSTLSTA